MKVCVIGTGYVGLTTGLCLAWTGHDVACVDVDSEKVARLSRGESVIYEPGLAELMASVSARVRYTSDVAEGIRDAAVIFIAVGTPTQADGTPDLRQVLDAGEQIGRNLGDRGFTVVVNKSTVPIGSGNWVDSIIREYAPSGRFVVASNPEFMREGSAIHDSLYPDRIVIGVDGPRALNTLRELFHPVTSQSFPSPAFAPRPAGFRASPIMTTDITSAELIKYASNSFLSLKISFANEIGTLAERAGADIRQVMRGIGLDERIGPRFLEAGIGWGGSCFGKDTAALVATGRGYGIDMRIVQAARDVNYGQRERAVEKLRDALKTLAGRTIGILGLAFKANTDDLRDSPALDIAQRLIGRGAKVRAHDPAAMENTQRSGAAGGIRLCAEAANVFEGADAVLLATSWPEYSQLPWADLAVRMRTRIVLDGRNVLDREALTASGYQYIGMGW